MDLEPVFNAVASEGIGQELGRRLGIEGDGRGQDCNSSGLVPEIRVK